MKATRLISATKVSGLTATANGKIGESVTKGVTR
jgi:hypothetical protein